MGSRYHDFIQSADAISTMKGCSDAIVGRIGGEDVSPKGTNCDNTPAGQEVLRGLAYYSANLIEKTSLLLSNKAEANNVVAVASKASSTSGTTSELSTSSSSNLSNTQTKLSATSEEFECPDSSKVWNRLESCDAFNAAAYVAVATLILATNSADFDPLNTNKDFTSAKYIDSKLLSVVKECCLHEEVANTYTKKIVKDAKECIFLRHTVLQDIDLIILEGSASVHEKAECLCQALLR